MNHEDKRREELFTDPKEIVAFAQAYYATEFPNDERRGCPTLETLRRAAHSGIAPDARLRSHLFGCSECFRSYRSARLGRHAQAAPAASWREWLGARLAPLRSPWVPAAAGAFSLILLVLVAAALLRQARTDSPAVAVNYTPQSASPSPRPEMADAAAAPGPAEVEPRRQVPDRQPPKRAPRATKAPPKNARTQRFLRVVYVDLKEDGLLRGENEAAAGRRVITLAPERQRLRLRMPRGSAAGRYTVRVVDAFGRPLLTAAARSDGRKLTVDLDLRGLTEKSYRLCLSRGGEAPDCYLMSVAAVK